MDSGNLAIIWLLLSSLAFFATLISIYYLRSRENMGLIEKGINPRNTVNKKENRPQPFVSLKIGAPLVGAGIGLFIARWLNLVVFPQDNTPVFYFALIAIGAGIGFLISYKIEMKWWERKENE